MHGIQTPKSRSERSLAKAVGSVTYFTGRPCNRGHISNRRTHDGRCLECWSQKVFPSQSSAKTTEYSARWRRKFPDREQEVKYRFRYGIELSEIRPKPTICELCERQHKKIVFDHCHASGKFRGWICDPCNVALGIVGDNIDILQRMIAYLKGESAQ